jgi:hypothetical protein
MSDIAVFLKLLLLTVGAMASLAFAVWSYRRMRNAERQFRDLATKSQV